MNKDLLNYRFIVPYDEDGKKFLNKKFKDKKQSSDGSPFCTFNEGWILSNEELESIDKDSIKLRVYEIRDNFCDIDDFISAFLDGDVEDDDFIKID